jgi:fatty acid desaturase
VQLDPRDKARLDALTDSTQRKKSRRAWRVWLIVAFTSLALVLSAQFDLIHPYLRIAMVVIGSVGLLMFLVFLSTKPYGHWDSSGFWW